MDTLCKQTRINIEIFEAHLQDWWPGRQACTISLSLLTSKLIAGHSPVTANNNETYICTVMGLGVMKGRNHLTVPVLAVIGDKIQWPKDIRHCAHIVRGCAEEGDTKAKSMLVALCMLLFGLSLPWMQEVHERDIESEEIIIHYLVKAYVENKLSVIEQLSSYFAKDSALGALKSLPSWIK